MATHVVTCVLYEPDGAALTSGSCVLDDSAPARELYIQDLGAPGRLVQRCLAGPVRRVWLHLRDGRLASAEVARLSFDPTHGRSCVLRMCDGGLTRKAAR